MGHFWNASGVLDRCLSGFPSARIEGNPQKSFRLSPLYLSAITFRWVFNHIARSILRNPFKNGSIESARLDLVGSRSHFVDFHSLFCVPSENTNFQHSESLKHQLFRFFSIFSRHCSTGYATELYKQCRIRCPFTVRRNYAEARRRSMNPIRSEFEKGISKF